MESESSTAAPEVRLDSWAILELFGHTRLAGRCSSVSIAGSGFIRVQVPAHKGRAAYTRDVAPKAVYAINPCDEAAALAALENCSESPVVELTWQAMREAMRQEAKTHPALPASGPEEDPDDDDDDDNEPRFF